MDEDEVPLAQLHALGAAGSAQVWDGASRAAGCGWQKLCLRCVRLANSVACTAATTL
jgi:hypothetical protein